MPRIAVMKQGGVLIPADAMTTEFLTTLKTGDVIHAEFKKKRNPKFHRKYFALLNFAFEHAEHGDYEYQGQKVEPNFDEFRSNLAILAGYFKPVFDINGNVHLRAKSISFANMDELEFEGLYNKTIDVILKKVLKNYSRDQLDDVVFQLMGFL